MAVIAAAYEALNGNIPGVPVYIHWIKDDRAASMPRVILRFSGSGRDRYRTAGTLNCDIFSRGNDIERCEEIKTAIRDLLTDRLHEYGRDAGIRYDYNSENYVEDPNPAVIHLNLVFDVLAIYTPEEE